MRAQIAKRWPDRAAPSRDSAFYVVVEGEPLSGARSRKDCLGLCCGCYHW